MGIVKLYVLDHVSDDMVTNRGLFACNQVYKYLHTLFKPTYETTYNRRKRFMDDSITLPGLRLSDEDRTTTRKRPKQNTMVENRQEILIISRGKSCEDDTV